MAVSGFLPGVGKNLPEGGKKIARYPPFTSAFFAVLHNITNLRPLFDILYTCYKEIHKIYLFNFFLFVFYLLYASLIPSDVLGLRGVKTLQKVRWWRGGPRHPLWNRLWVGSAVPREILCPACNPQQPEQNHPVRSAQLTLFTAARHFISSNAIHTSEIFSKMA